LTTARELHRLIGTTHPAVAGELCFALIGAHCAIELASPGELDAMAPATGPATGSRREVELVGLMRARIHECCRAGDFLRASCLLRLIAPLDPAIGDAYADDMLTRRTSASPPDDAPPRFLADHHIADWSIDDTRRRHRGKRVLLVRRYGFAGGTARRHETNDNIARTGAGFGLTVHEIDSRAPAGAATERYAATLRQAIDGFAPDIIFYDELFLSGVSALPEPAAAIATVLESARERGARVVKSYTDAWYVAAHGPDSLFVELGRCYDLVHHCHPAILDRGSAAERAAVFCYPFPTVWPTPTEPAATLARAGFVGAIHPGSVARLVWWAEAARAGLPLDFVEARHDADEQRSDLDYINLLRRYAVSVNFSLRPTGARILTARTLEVPLAGGVLVEEDNPDTRYFMTPDVHYAAFATLPDLATLLPALLDASARRRALADAAHDWVARYFTGDYFWTGLLRRLYD
jgi:hypothetical protein